MLIHSWPRVIYDFLQKIDFLEILFWNFISIQGVQGAIPESPEPIPELRNEQIYLFQNLVLAKEREAR